MSSPSAIIIATTITTPIGDLAVLVDPSMGATCDHSSDSEPDVVVGAGFTTPQTLFDRLISGPDRDGRCLSLVSTLGPIGDSIEAYFEGELDSLAAIKVGQPGTPFQRQVWDELRTTRPGQSVSYQQLADSVGRPRAVRAVGSACGRNLVAPIVPCHRVLRHDGSLGGYYYGLGIKRWLLDHEAAEL